MSFARALFTVSGFTLISRVAGFVRDMLTAMFLGAGFQADAFFVAQRLPNLFRSLFAEGAFSAAFVPLYTAEKERHGDEEAQKFAGQAMALLVSILAPFSLLVMLGMSWVIQLMAPGFSDEPEKFELAIRYSTITFPYLLFISITALQSGVLNANDRFAPGAAAPILLNIIMITALFTSHLMGWEVGESLAWAMLIAGLIQAGFLAINCYRARMIIPLVWPRMTDACRVLFRKVGPGAVGAGATQINLLVTTILASILPTGAVSYLYYADRLNQLPLGIIGIAVATTLLPILSRHEANADQGAIKHTTCRAIEFCLVLGLPAALGLGIAAQPIIQTLFEHGAFTHQDTLQTALTLSAYTLCIPAFLMAKVLAARFFAQHDTKTPVRIAIICMAANVIMALLLLGLLKHVGMALATSLATWLNAYLLYRVLKKKGSFELDDTLKRRLPRLAVCIVAMAALTIYLVQVTSPWFAQPGVLLHIGGLVVIIGLSSLMYAVLLHVTKAMRLSELMTQFKKNEQTDDN